MVTVVSIIGVESLARVLLALWWCRSVLRWWGLVVLVAKAAKPSTLVVLRLLLTTLVVLGARHPSCAVHRSQALATTATVADARPDDEEGNEEDEDNGGQDPATPVAPA